MQFNLNDININIDVSAGIYNLGFNGATGKTYLYLKIVDIAQVVTYNVK